MCKVRSSWQLKTRNQTRYANILNLSFFDFTVLGVWRNRRGLILPWILVQGFLAALLSAMALYFLVLFPGLMKGIVILV